MQSVHDLFLLGKVGSAASWIIMLTMYCCCRRTVVDVKLLQLWDSMRLCNTTISLSGFLKAIADAAATLHPTQV
jgi:hypothetical protein